MTSPTGDVLLSQRFTPFGEVKEKYGEVEANFGYAGQKYDAQTGLLYLRARYYAPGLGRLYPMIRGQGIVICPCRITSGCMGMGIR